MQYLDILNRHESTWIQFQKNSPKQSWWLFSKSFSSSFSVLSFLWLEFCRALLCAPGDKDFCDEARRLRSAAAMVRRHPNSRQCPKGKSNAPVTVQLAVSWQSKQRLMSDWWIDRWNCLYSCRNIILRAIGWHRLSLWFPGGKQHLSLHPDYTATFHLILSMLLALSSECV